MKIAAANPLWGAPRIHCEFGKLGIEVSERTVSRLVRRPRRPPSQTWRTFLTNHVPALGSMDFFTVPTVTGRILFVFVVLLHQRRRIVHFNVTEHPTAAWTAQQVVEAFPDDTAPRWLLRDRDAIYGEAFRQRVAGMGIGEVLSAPSSSTQTDLKFYVPTGRLTDDLVAESIGGVRHISIRGDHVQAIEKYDRWGAGACALEEELHSVAALAGIIGFEVRASRCEEREAALAGERLSKLSLDPAI